MNEDPKKSNLLCTMSAVTEIYRRPNLRSTDQWKQSVNVSTRNSRDASSELDTPLLGARSSQPYPFNPTPTQLSSLHLPHATSPTTPGSLSPLEVRRKHSSTTPRGAPRAVPTSSCYLRAQPRISRLLRPMPEAIPIKGGPFEVEFEF